jgi:hypothetical protein
MQKPQVSASIEKELYDEIAEMAEKQSRSVSAMVAILLQQAVKEKKRKSKHGLLKRTN